VQSESSNDAVASTRHIIRFNPNDRRHFIGGSDARIIMGDDQDLVRLWREKRGELSPPDFSQNLIVQLGSATEELNRRWFERCTGQHVRDVQISFRGISGASRWSSPAIPTRGKSAYRGSSSNGCLVAVPMSHEAEADEAG
jgi:hypothetical protein